jgi:hypothetical protein
MSPVAVKLLATALNSIKEGTLEAAAGSDASESRDISKKSRDASDSKVIRKNVLCYKRRRKCWFKSPVRPSY